jgi:hypothetical protein
MRLRQTAALALLGWWLLVPYRGGRMRMEYAPDLPLPEWGFLAGNFQSVDKCEAERTTRQTFLKQHVAADTLKDVRTTVGCLYLLYTKAICVEDNDPRFPQLRPSSISPLRQQDPK